MPPLCRRTTWRGSRYGAVQEITARPPKLIRSSISAFSAQPTKTERLCPILQAHHADVLKSAGRPAAHLGWIPSRRDCRFLWLPCINDALKASSISPSPEFGFPFTLNLARIDSIRGQVPRRFALSVVVEFVVVPRRSDSDLFDRARATCFVVSIRPGR